MSLVCKLIRSQIFRRSPSMSSFTTSPKIPTPSAHALVFMEPDEKNMRLELIYKFNSKETNLTFDRQKNEPLKLAFKRIKLAVIRSIHPPSKAKKSKKKAKLNGKEEQEQEQEEETIQISLLNNDGREVDINVPHHQAWTTGSTLIVKDQQFKIILNGPKLMACQFSNKPLIGFMIYPILTFKNATYDDCNFAWYKLITSENGFKKELIGQEFFYYPNDKDLGYKLEIEVTPKNEQSFGLVHSSILQEPVQLGPTNCPFLERHKYTSSLTGPGYFRFVSYNILADYYASMKSTATTIFPYCPVEYLKFEYRKPLLIKELIGYNGDIICLQEVDRKFFTNELSYILDKIAGLEGIFIRKTGREIQVPEGIAIFYRKAKFNLLQSSTFELTNLCLEGGDHLSNYKEAVIRNSNLIKRMNERNTVFQIALLECLDQPGKALLVVNTHLYSNPTADHVRLLQASIILTHTEKLLKEFKEKYHHLDISPVISGDFNSDPMNGVYKLYTEGSISNDHGDWNSEPEEVIKELQVKHNFKLKSAYGTPEFTNYTENYIGCLDYIFYESTKIQVDSLVPFPSLNVVKANIALPSPVFPSDHLALISVLKWI